MTLMGRRFPNVASSLAALYIHKCILQHQNRVTAFPTSCFSSFRSLFSGLNSVPKGPGVRLSWHHPLTSHLPAQDHSPVEGWKRSRRSMHATLASKQLSFGTGPAKYPSTMRRALSAKESRQLIRCPKDAFPSPIILWSVHFRILKSRDRMSRRF